ncbi:GDSL-type esterase/lipase family protein [Streptomyces sp. NPDC001941]|uniref:GDSL-type esterase/lipase family protein n=1 Tax=Streptomyces sp. NPDC001941 TaxID=3154659 RepID=UPI00331F83C6
MSHRRRFRTALLSLTAAAAVLTGCSAAPDAPAGGSPAPTRPSPSPTPLWDRSPSSVAAVGDSITRGFDACGVLSDCPEVSWSTGTDPAVDSLAVRLLGASKTAGNSWNLARSGSRMAELPGQMERAAAERPGLVTVMTGANDACRDTAAQMTPVADFRASFERALRTLRAASPKSQVYVASVPDLKRLWSTGRTSAMAKQVWGLGICRSMLADPDDLTRAGGERRDRVRARVAAYNAVLRDVCAKDERCRYDGGDVFAYRFTGQQLSPWDWFHPSRDGQARLAEIAYRRVTAAS